MYIFKNSLFIFRDSFIATCTVDDDDDDDPHDRPAVPEEASLTEIVNFWSVFLIVSLGNFRSFKMTVKHS
jgi:hypothetical protein